MGRHAVSIIFVVCGLLGAQVAAAEVTVTNQSGETVGELVGIWDDRPDFWVVYNATLERLFVIDSETGNLVPMSPFDACPYFEDGSNCSGQVYLARRWQGWIIRCGSRNFQATEVFVTITGLTMDRLTFGGYCSSANIANAINLVEADEFQVDDLPFQHNDGPLQMEQTAQQQLTAVDAVGRGGLLALVALIAGAGILLIRRIL